MIPKRLALLLLLLPVTACANQTPYVTTVGVLPPGSTLSVRVAAAAVGAYQPAGGEARNRFTVAATALARSTPPPPPRLRPRPGGVAVDALAPLAELLVRVPDGVNLAVRSDRGDVHVTGIEGNATVVALQGDVQVMLPGYAQVRAGRGNVSVTMGSTGWPGTLHFSTQHGNIELWINENAKFDVRLHTDRGTLFTDFDLRGSAQGTAETIDGSVNGGGSHAIDVETSAGTIRLLRLHPQA